MINVGLIGYGMGGRIFHAPLVNHVEGLRLMKIRTTKDEQIRLATERYPEAVIVSDAQEILSDPEIDLVIVAVPNKFHYELAKAGLARGKHVIVEKPFTVTSGEAQELIDLAIKQNKIITVYQNRRWDSDFLTVKMMLMNKKLGRLVEYEAHYDRFRNTLRPGTWKEEGTPGTGLLYDLGSHLIDQALVLFGVPEAVTAFMLKQRDNSRIVDSFELILHYSSLKVTLKSGMLVKGALPKYILLGTDGSFVKSGLDVQEADLNEGTRSLSDETWGEEPAAIWGCFTYEEDGDTVEEVVDSVPGNYATFYENVRDAILGTTGLIVTPEQARNTIRVIEIAMRSHHEKRTIPFE